MIAQDTSDVKAVMKLVNLLWKLRIANLDPRGVSMYQMSIGGINPHIPKSRFIVPTSLHSLSMGWAVLIPYKG